MNEFKLEAILQSDLPLEEIHSKLRDFFREQNIMFSGAIEGINEKLPLFEIIFFDRFVNETKVENIRAKNKHQARHIFWDKYPKNQYHDCIESILEV